MKLSRTVAYAVQASLHLARSEPHIPIPCSQLASEGRMPERFLLQILRNLVARGILSSTRGVDGGYSLERPADEVSLLEVIEAIDGPMISTLPLSEGLPPSAQDRLREAINEVTEHTREQLAAIKLSHLLPAPPPQGQKTA
ncbi:MAG: Rrf2 family transcriptional regulator [Pirellulales bacterium]|nr:Rrf2 family transcriptional regulator [Pirellulales bacterium]